MTHIDDKAIEGLTKYYSTALPKDATGHLDLCSSWVSFLPEGYAPARCVGLGMSAPELEANKQLTETTVQDLNTTPELPYDAASFDAVTNVVSEWEEVVVVVGGLRI